MDYKKLFKQFEAARQSNDLEALKSSLGNMAQYGRDALKRQDDAIEVLKKTLPKLR